MEGQVHWITMAVILGSGLGILLVVALEAFLATKR